MKINCKFCSYEICNHCEVCGDLSDCEHKKIKYHDSFDARIELFIDLWKKHYKDCMTKCDDCNGFGIHVCETALRKMLSVQLKVMDKELEKKKEEFKAVLERLKLSIIKKDESLNSINNHDDELGQAIKKAKSQMDFGFNVAVRDFNQKLDQEIQKL